MTSKLNRMCLALILIWIAVGPLSAARAGDNLWTGIGPAGESVQAIVAHPTEPNTIFVATTNGLFRSTDGGDHWAAINSGLTITDVTHLVIDPVTPTTLYAASSTTVYKTTDSGDTWTARYTTPYPIHALAIAPSTPTTLYISDYDGVYKTTNGGTNWGFAGLYNYDVRELAVDPTTATTVYAGTWGGGIYKSTNSGGNWASVSSNWYIFSLVIAPTTPATLYAGTNQGVQRSTNAAGSWTVVNSIGTSVGALSIDPATPTTIYANIYNNSVYKSTNSGNTWVQVGTDELIFKSVQTLAVNSATPAAVYAGLASDGVYAMRQITYPVPTLTDLSPTRAHTDDLDFTLTLTGTNFVAGSVVKWDTTTLATTYVNATQLTATVPASALSAPRSVNITVFNPAPGGGTSAVLKFTITYPYAIYLPCLIR